MHGEGLAICTDVKGIVMALTLWEKLVLVQRQPVPPGGPGTISRDKAPAVPLPPHTATTQPYARSQAFYPSRRGAGAWLRGGGIKVPLSPLLVRDNQGPQLKTP